jgi:predicted GIY-YIG superfamily endonuclease
VTLITAGPTFPDHFLMRDPRYYCVYIMGSLTGTLYIGVSGNLHKRVFQHKFHHYEGFTARYEVVRLLYWESYDDVHKALAREKQLKGWARAPRKSPCWNAAIRSGKTWPQSGTRGWSRVKVGMLRLRSEIALRTHYSAQHDSEGGFRGLRISFLVGRRIFGASLVLRGL